MKRILLLLMVGIGACGGRQGSVGAMLGKNERTGKLLVRDTPRDMEAAKAGLAPGDEILSIDGEDVRNLSPEAIHERLSGPVGTSVDVTAVRDDQILRVRVKRGPLK